MKLKSLALAVSILMMLILALSSPFIFSQTKAQNQKDPSILMRCIPYIGWSGCSFTTNTPPSGQSVLLLLYATGAPDNVRPLCPSGWLLLYQSSDTNHATIVCYETSTSAITLTNFGPSGSYDTYAVFEIDYISGMLSITAYGGNSYNQCTGFNSAHTQAWEAIYTSSCGYDNQMTSSSFWLVFQMWYNVGGNIQCHDAYCSVWSPAVLNYYPILVSGSAGPSNNGWTGASISGNISATLNTGGGPWDSNAQGRYTFVLVQAGPVSLGGNNNGAITTTISLTQTQTNFVAPSPTSVQYWIIPMFLILGVGALLLMIGRYAGMTGGDTFMLFVLGAWLGSIFGLMANIVPIAIVIVISIVMIFMIWRKVS